MARRIFWVFLLLLLMAPTIAAQSYITDVCPGVGIQPRGADFQPGGIILTAFDAENLWVYDIDANTRYPLPQTNPCINNCHLSPDATWISYLNPETFLYNKMRLDGTDRQPLASNASDVSWWSADTLLIWTPDHRAFLRPEADALAVPEELPVDSVREIQPGGRYGLLIATDEQGEFQRYMVNLETRGTDAEQRVRLAPDRPYFNAAAWSPDGRTLAYVGNGALDPSVNATGAELFFIQPGSSIPQQATFLFAEYGAVRINGYLPEEISWSPDSRYLAFWVIELLGSDVEANTGNATLHLLDAASGEVRRYCGFATTSHTPKPPRIIWSPDGTHIAFAGDVAQDGRGALVLALNIESGLITELSEGVYPALGIPDLVAWGNRP